MKFYGVVELFLVLVLGIVLGLCAGFELCDR